MAHFNTCNTEITFFQCTVQTIMQVDDTGVRRRTAHRLRRRVYHGVGPNGVIHIDGYDKLKPFGFAIPGAICGYSRKILWLHGCPSNKDPKRIASYFVNYLRKMQGVLTLIRTDTGTENMEIHAIQVALRLGHRDSMSGYRSVFIGRSTSNQTACRDIEEQQLGCRFDIMDYESYFFVF